MFLISTAVAADAQPALYGLSARPNDEVAVELHGVASNFGIPGLGQTQTMALLHGTLVLSDRVTVDLRASVSSLVTCNNAFFMCGRSTPLDGSARVGVAVFDNPRFRLLPFIGVGTTVEGGLALWWQSPDERFEFDLSAAAVFQTEPLLPGPPDRWEEIDDPPPNLRWREDLLRPEFGITIHLDVHDRHHLRIGQFGVTPTLTYRGEAGRVAFEVMGGTVIAASVFALGVAVAI